MKKLCERLFKEGWYVLYLIKFFLFLILKLISEYANIVVVEAAQVIYTDVDIINFAALEESAN